MISGTHTFLLLPFLCTFLRPLVTMLCPEPQKRAKAAKVDKTDAWMHVTATSVMTLLVHVEKLWLESKRDDNESGTKETGGGEVAMVPVPGKGNVHGSVSFIGHFFPSSHGYDTRAIFSKGSRECSLFYSSSFITSPRWKAPAWSVSNKGDKVYVIESERKGVSEGEDSDRESTMSIRIWPSPPSLCLSFCLYLSPSLPRSLPYFSAQEKPSLFFPADILCAAIVILTGATV